MKLNGEIKRQVLKSVYDKEGNQSDVIELTIDVDVNTKVSLDEIRQHVGMMLLFDINSAQMTTV